MIIPPTLVDEKQRLKILYELKVLDTPSEERYDRVTNLAASVFDVPIALVSLVESDRQWFKSCFGLSVSQTSKDVSFCAHAIEQKEVMVVEDATKDKRFFDNPLVIEEPKIRFYAGVPIIHKNQAIGTFCIIDRKARAFDKTKQNMLKDFAKMIEAELNHGQVFVENKEFHAVQRLNDAITHVQSLFINDSYNENVFKTLLDDILRITECELGVIGEVFYDDDQQPFLETRAVSYQSVDNQYQQFFKDNAINGLEFRNTESLLGQVLESKNTIICDPYDATPRINMPAGHPVLKNFLGIPIFYGEKLVAEVVLANRNQGFTQALTEFLTPLTLTLGQLIHSNRVKQHQLKLQSSLSQFKRSVDMALDCVFMFDARTCRFFYVNEGARKQVGYSADEMLQMHAFDIKPGFTAKQFKELLSSIIESNNHSGTFKTVHQHKSGDLIDVEIFLQYFAPEDQSPYFIAFVRDITETKQFIEELKLGNQIFNSAHDCILVTDADNTILKVNQSCEKIFGYTVDELIGQNIRILRSNQHTPEFYDAMRDDIYIRGEWQGEVWDRHKNGSIIPILSSISTIYDKDGNADKRIATLIDITKEKTAQEHISKLAHYDSLTDLPNRKLSTDRLEHAISINKRRRNQVFVLFIDLDDFKTVNDTYGHHVGDELLCTVAEKLKSSLRSSDTVGRLGGDEFVVIIEDAHNAYDIKKTIEQIFKKFSQPEALSFGEYFVSLSIGIASFPEDGQDGTELLKNADMAMYSAKKAGKNKSHFYSRHLSDELEGQLEIHNDLRAACRKSQLELHYQPILETKTKKVMGVESLCRWQHPIKGWMPPDVFIPIAETSELIHDIGEWVLKTSCQQYVDWLEQGIKLDFISVNVSGLQIMQTDFANKVRTILQETNCPASVICIELTESFAMEDSEGAFGKIQALKDIGVTIAIDDFGTGYSSLSYLKKLPVKRIKLDRSFVSDIPDDPNDVAIAKAVIALGKAVGMEIVAEGAETLAQYDFLLAQNCKYTQGYLFSKPLEQAAFIDYFRKNSQHI